MFVIWLSFDVWYLLFCRALSVCFNCRLLMRIVEVSQVSRKVGIVV